MEEKRTLSRVPSPALRRAVKKFQAQFEEAGTMNQTEIIHKDNSMDSDQVRRQSDDN